MGTIDEIKRMQQQGRTEQDVKNSLRVRGLSGDEIENVMSQAQIKNAVSQPFDRGNVQEPSVPIPGQQELIQEQETEYSAPAQQDYYAGMQPSIMQQQDQDDGVSQPEEQIYPNEGQTYDSGYPSYQPYQEAFSSDVITEISEQVVSERLSVLRDKMEEAINFKSVAEAKVSSLNERLERIEGIIDRLQLSILQKVGDYIGDVKDVKFELQETQKSFKKLVPELKHNKKEKKHTP